MTIIFYICLSPEALPGKGISKEEQNFAEDGLFNLAKVPGPSARESSMRGHLLFPL